MIVIRLQRIGKKHQPSYRVVVANKRSKLEGPPVEDLGSYNPFTKAFALNKERLAHWIGIGAQPTVSAHNLFVKHKAVEGKAHPVKMKKKTAATPEAATQEQPSA